MAGPRQNEETEKTRRGPARPVWRQQAALSGSGQQDLCETAADVSPATPHADAANDDPANATTDPCGKIARSRHTASIERAMPYTITGTRCRDNRHELA